MARTSSTKIGSPLHPSLQIRKEAIVGCHKTVATWRSAARTKMMVYDVRRLASANKDSAILSMFDGLHTGEAVQVVCDFDPSRLERKFKSFFAEEYIWTCVQRGPPDWHIEIGKISTLPECGCK